MATDIGTNQAKSVSEPNSLPNEHRPSVEHLITEDGNPLDNIFSDKQKRLLTEPLYASWKPDARFLGYARIRIPFYVIFDPEQWLGGEKLRFYELHGGQYKLNQSSMQLMPLIGLGITLWNGSFE